MIDSMFVCRCVNEKKIESFFLFLCFTFRMRTFQLLTHPFHFENANRTTKKTSNINIYTHTHYTRLWQFNKFNHHYQTAILISIILNLAMRQICECKTHNFTKFLIFHLSDSSSSSLKMCLSFEKIFAHVRHSVHLRFLYEFTY